MATEKTKKENGTASLVFGDDELKVSSKAKGIVNDHCPPDQQGLSLETIDGESKNSEQAVEAIQNCIAALRTLGFFGGGKTVWLRDAQFLDQSPVGKSSAVKDALKPLGEMVKEGLPDGIALVVSANKVFKGSSFYKAFKAAGKVHEFSLAAKPHLREKDARQEAARLFSEAGISATPGLLETFIGRCGSDPRQIVQEVEKLSLYLGDRKDLKLEDIAIITTPAAEAQFWELADAAAKRDTATALRLIRQQTEHDSSCVGMIMGIEKRFQLLLILRECMRNKIFFIAKRGRESIEWNKSPENESLLDSIFTDPRQDPRKMHPYRLLMLCKDALKFSRSELRNNLHAILETHEKIVSSSLPEPSLMEMLILKITKPQQR